MLQGSLVLLIYIWCCNFLRSRSLSLFIHWMVIDKYWFCVSLMFHKWYMNNQYIILWNTLDIIYCWWKNITACLWGFPIVANICNNKTYNCINIGNIIIKRLTNQFTTNKWNENTFKSDGCRIVIIFIVIAIICDWFLWLIHCKSTNKISVCNKWYHT